MADDLEARGEAAAGASSALVEETRVRLAGAGLARRPDPSEGGAAGGAGNKAAQGRVLTAVIPASQQQPVVVPTTTEKQIADLLAAIAEREAALEAAFEKAAAEREAAFAAERKAAAEREAAFAAERKAAAEREGAERKAAAEREAAFEKKFAELQLQLSRTRSMESELGEGVASEETDLFRQFFQSHKQEAHSEWRGGPCLTCAGFLPMHLSEDDTVKYTRCSTKTLLEERDGFSNSLGESAQKALKEATQFARQAYIEASKDFVLEMEQNLDQLESANTHLLSRGRNSLSLAEVAALLARVHEVCTMTHGGIGTFGEVYYDHRVVGPTLACLVKRSKLRFNTREVMVSSTRAEGELLRKTTSRKVDGLVTDERKQNREILFFENSVCVSGADMHRDEDRVKLALTVYRSLMRPNQKHPALAVHLYEAANSGSGGDQRVLRLNVSTVVPIHAINPENVAVLQGYEIVELDDFPFPLQIEEGNAQHSKDFRDAMVSLCRIAECARKIAEEECTLCISHQGSAEGVTASGKNSAQAGRPNMETPRKPDKGDKSKRPSGGAGNIGDAGNKRCACSEGEPYDILFSGEFSSVRTHGQAFVSKGPKERRDARNLEETIFDVRYARELALREIDAYAYLSSTLMATETTRVARPVKLCVAHLRVVLPKLAPIDWDAARRKGRLALAADLVEGVVQLHSADIAHADLKPGAWMADRDNGRPVLVDLNQAVCHASMSDPDEVPHGTLGWSFQCDGSPLQAFDNDERSLGLVVAWAAVEGFAARYERESAHALFDEMECSDGDPVRAVARGLFEGTMSAGYALDVLQEELTRAAGSQHASEGADSCSENVSKHKPDGADLCSENVPSAANATTVTTSAPDKRAAPLSADPTNEALAGLTPR